MPTRDDRGDAAEANVPEASSGELKAKMMARPYCPCCHHFDNHGPACPISGGELSGQPIT